MFLQKFCYLSIKQDVNTQSFCEIQIVFQIFQCFRKNQIDDNCYFLLRCDQLEVINYLIEYYQKEIFDVCFFEIQNYFVFREYSEYFFQMFQMILETIEEYHDIIYKWFDETSAFKQHSIRLFLHMNWEARKFHNRHIELFLIAMRNDCLLVSVLWFHSSLIEIKKNV